MNSPIVLLSFIFLFLLPQPNNWFNQRKRNREKISTCFLAYGITSAYKDKNDNLVVIVDFSMKNATDIDVEGVEATLQVLNPFDDILLQIDFSSYECSDCIGKNVVLEKSDEYFEFTQSTIDAPRYTLEFKEGDKLYNSFKKYVSEILEVKVIIKKIKFSNGEIKK